jgi:hypothetical protein
MTLTGLTNRKAQMRRLLAAAAIMAAAAVGVAGCGAGGPSQSDVQSQTLKFLHNNNVGASSVSCNLPSNWASGQTFKCFVYQGSKGLGTVNSTVLSPASKGEWNESYTPGG